MGGFFTSWATFLPAAVASYSRAYPRVQLELRQLQLRQLEPEPALREVRAGELDLAVTYRYPAIDGELADDRLEPLHLLDDPYAVALPARHPLAARSQVSLADLAGERWVSPPAATPYTRLLRRLCREEGGFEPDVGFETLDIAMAQPLVASGLAVGLLPLLGLRPRHDGVAVRPMPSMPPARSVEVVRARGRRTPTAGPMLEALRSAARAA